MNTTEEMILNETSDIFKHNNEVNDYDFSLITVD